MTWPTELKEKLTLWQTHIPSLYDFDRGFDTFRLENYLYVLYGMDYPTKIEDTAYRFQSPNKGLKQFEIIKQQSAQLANHLDNNLVMINKIKQYGLSKI